jgi:D-alanine-D-alanine ligase-like ATP-grasp enzyme
MNVLPAAPVEAATNDADVMIAHAQTEALIELAHEGTKQAHTMAELSEHKLDMLLDRVMDMEEKYARLEGKVEACLADDQEKTTPKTTPEIAEVTMEESKPSTPPEESPKSQQQAADRNRPRVPFGRRSR